MSVPSVAVCRAAVTLVPPGSPVVGPRGTGRMGRCYRPAVINEKASMSRIPLSTSKGVTLLELMITVLVLAVVLAIALPNFGTVIRSNRVATTSNEFMASVAYARSEAMRNNRGAVICPSTNGETCGGTWADGWIVWADRDGDGIQGGTETPLRVQGPLVRQTAPGNTAIRFSPRGTVVSGPATVTLQPSDCKDGEGHRRVFSVLGGGMVRMAKEACA